MLHKADTEVGHLVDDNAVHGEKPIRDENWGSGASSRRVITAVNFDALVGRDDLAAIGPRVLLADGDGLEAMCLGEVGPAVEGVHL